MKSLTAVFVVLILSSGIVSAAPLCGAVFQANDKIDFKYDAQINPTVRRQIELDIYELSRREGSFSQGVSTTVSVASFSEVVTKASSWNFVTRANGSMENRLLTKMNVESTPRSLVQYKMTYEDGTVVYSEVFENQIVADRFFINAWTFAGPQYVTHGLPTEAWPTLLKQVTKASGHGQLKQIEKMVGSEIPVLSVKQDQKSDILALLDSRYEGLTARLEQRDLRHRGADAKYILSFVLANGATISKTLR